MEKMQVKLCAGTMCYIMGEAQLTKVSDKAKESVEISLASCLGYGDKRKKLHLWQ